MADKDQGAGSRKHAQVVREILARCGSRPDCRLWANNTGVGRGLTGDSFIRFGLRGSADILGIFFGGYFLGIEVKTGSATQSKSQRAFDDMVCKFGGFYCIAGSADEAESILNRLSLDASEYGSLRPRHWSTPSAADRWVRIPG